MRHKFSQYPQFHAKTFIHKKKQFKSIQIRFSSLEFVRLSEKEKKRKKKPTHNSV